MVHWYTLRYSGPHVNESASVTTAAPRRTSTFALITAGRRAEPLLTALLDRLPSTRGADRAVAVAGRG